GHEQMRPLAERERLVGKHFDRVLFPGMDEMGTDAVVFQPQVPAAVAIISVVHSGENGAELRPLREFDPGTKGEGLVLLGVSSRGNREDAAGMALEGFVGEVPGVPSRLSLDDGRTGFAACNKINGIASALTKRCMKIQALTRNACRHFL